MLFDHIGYEIPDDDPILKYLYVKSLHGEKSNSEFNAKIRYLASIGIEWAIELLPCVRSMEVTIGGLLSEKERQMIRENQIYICEILQDMYQ